MKKRIFAIFTVCLLCALLCGPALADNEGLIRDDAGLLDSDEKLELEKLAAEVCDEYDFQLVVVTVNGTDGKDIAAFADELYENGGYLDDGAVLVLDMQSRDWYISTAGRGEYALSDYKIDLVADEVIPYLSAGDYFEGFRLFIEECKQHVESYDNGAYIPDDGDYHDYDYDYDYGDENRTAERRGVNPLWIPGSLAAGILSALVATGSMKGQMNNVSHRTNASGYTKKGSLNLTEKQDTFLYQNISRTPRPKDDSNRSGPGGGSFGGGIHMSAGGVSHGGHGGKF
ncbi:MAG: TPM domain-containing protein [Bacillota bacterium]|nr:TPM domain-containing protein [Bacillota bacterium]